MNCFLILHMTSKSRRSMWYLDNGCSRHMTRDKTKFKNFKRKEQGFITYEDNNKGKNTWNE